MPLFKCIWNLPTDLALYKGAFIVFADDSEHAIQRAKNALGPEGEAAAWRLNHCEGGTYELGRNTIPTDVGPANPLPGLGREELFAFELAARINVVAATEQAAFARFARAVKDRQSDGKYVKLYRDTVLEKESMSTLSRFEKHALEKSFRAVQGGGTSPR